MNTFTKSPQFKMSKIDTLLKHLQGITGFNLSCK